MDSCLTRAGKMNKKVNSSNWRCRPGWKRPRAKKKKSRRGFCGLFDRGPERGKEERVLVIKRGPHRVGVGVGRIPDTLTPPPEFALLCSGSLVLRYLQCAVLRYREPRISAIRPLSSAATGDLRPVATRRSGWVTGKEPRHRDNCPYMEMQQDWTFSFLVFLFFVPHS